MVSGWKPRQMYPIRDLRLMMVAHSSEPLEDASEALHQWSQRFRSLYGAEIRSCLWITGASADRVSFSNLPGCVHVHQMNPEVDRYVRVWDPGVPRLPWGLKSGPNSQFFAILSRMAKLHNEGWVLQLEADVHSLRPIKPTDLPSHSDDLWVMGALTHKSGLRTLERRLWGHLNGAAFYHIGNPQFRRFLNTVWKPSLLYLLHQRPDYAYDCLSSPAVWDLLPEGLKSGWVSAYRHLRASPGMVNASSLDPNQVSGLVSELQGGVLPWFLHAPVGKTN